MPIDRRTRAPAPSDCSIAKKAWRIARGIDMFVGLLGAKSVGGMRGRPKKEEELEDALIEGLLDGVGVADRKFTSGD